MLKDHGLVWWSAGRSCSAASSLCVSAHFFSITNYSNTISNRLSVCFLHRFACTWHVEKKRRHKEINAAFREAAAAHSVWSAQLVNIGASCVPLAWCGEGRKEYRQRVRRAGKQEKVVVHQRVKSKRARTVYRCVPFLLAYLATVKQRWHTVLVWAPTRSPLMV